ncbi:MAG: TonB-dependent siderophore receptor [Deltaproteobacteria bacterium]|nr:TonB-dependent siderophore receptor [Deltaproteobacteria bacterium]
MKGLGLGLFSIFPSFKADVFFRGLIWQKQGEIMPLMRKKIIAAVILAAMGFILGYSSIKALAQTEDLPTVEVEATKTGRAEDGYLTENVQNVGPWNSMSLQNAPYSITILSKEFLDNAVGNSVNQFIKVMPNATTSSVFYNNTYTYTQTRGFDNAVALDGVRVTNSGLTTEIMDRVEIINGLTGFLYGGGYIGGLTNYVLKRPTSERYNSVTIGNAGGSQYYAQADFGGPFDKDNKFGYRINAFHSNGETVYKDLDVERSSIYGAFDWNITEKIKLQLDFLHAKYHQDNQPGSFFLLTWQNGIYQYPVKPENGKAYGQKWNFIDSETNSWGAKITWDINDIFTARASFRQRNFEWENMMSANRFSLAGDGKFAVNTTWSGPVTEKSTGGNFFIEAKFDTFGVKQTLTAGYSANKVESYAHQINFGSYGYTPDIYDQHNYHFDYFPSMIPQRYSDWGPLYKRNKNIFENWIIGDEIKFNDWLTVMAGVNRVKLTTRNYNVAGQTTASYEKWKASPSFSLIVNPIPTLSIYGTYIEALEAGTTVADDPSRFINAGEVLPPEVSEQYEFGVKYTLNDRLLLSAAYFSIDRVNDLTKYYPNGMEEITQDGREIHKGFEFSAVGKITDRLTVLGGATVFQSTLKKMTDKSLEGKHPYQSPTKMFKAYFEYDTPFVEGLTLNGGLYYMGKQYTDNNNQETTDPYTLVDLGARFVTNIKDVKTIFRFSVFNLTDECYWQRGYAGQLGEGRSFVFSVTTEF